MGKPLPEDPEQFNGLWEQLTPEQKDWLYEQDHSIGNHPGMPFVDRDNYNRQHLNELMQTTQGNIDQMQARYDELAHQAYTGDRSAATGNELAALGSQLTSARQQMDGYKAVNGVLDNKDGAPRLLAMIDDQGHAAVSIGNPDTASHTATFVPGTWRGPRGLRRQRPQIAGNVRRSAARQPEPVGWGPAVTTWMGYDRPMDMFEAAWPGRAEAGGAGLDSFIDMGHSYGSTVVGGAATGGNHLAADNVIAVGSPGMLSEHASNLSLADGANVYAMTARNDIISWATDLTLGADPFDTDFGATRLTSNPGTSYDPTEFIGSVDAHSSYWDNQSNPALQNMGADHRRSASRPDRHTRRRGRTRIMTTQTSWKQRKQQAITALTCLAAVSALSGCSDAAELGPTTPTGATDIGGPNMSSPTGKEPTHITPANQQQLEETLHSYIKKTLQALPPGYVLDATRFGGTGSGIIGCDDNATGPDAPVRLTVTGDLKVPAGVDNVAALKNSGKCGAVGDDGGSIPTTGSANPTFSA